MTEGVADAAETAVPEQIGPYEILEPLRGLDDWERYLATSGAELVQITVVHPDPGKVSLAARELARAMRQVTAVSGDHIVRTFRAEKNGEATLLITQHLAGRWLREILAGAGRLERGVAMRILLDVASGLAAVHEASAPHGDVRPASILIGDDGVARLGWLGLGSVAAFLRLPEPVRAARLPYRAPEEQRGRMASAAGDLYSFGVLVHELLVGAPPAPASPSGVTVTVTVDALRNAGLPDAFARFVPRLLSPTPSARPTSARAVREVLEEACTTIPAASREEIATLVRTARSIHPPSLRDAPVGDRDETEPRRGLETIELPPAQVPRLPVATVPPLVASTVRRTMTTPPPRTRAVTLAGPPPIPGDARKVPAPPSLKITRQMQAVKAPSSPSPPSPPPPAEMDVDVAVDEAAMIVAAALEASPDLEPVTAPAPAPVVKATPALTPMPMPPLHRPAMPPPAVEESIAWSEQGPHAVEPPPGPATAPVRPTPLPPPRRSSAPPPRNRREMPGWLLFLLMLLLGSIGGAYFGLRERARRHARREGQRQERIVDRTPAPLPREAPVASPPAPTPRVEPPPEPPPPEPPPPEPPPPEPPPPVEVAPPRPPPAPPPTKVAPPPHVPPTKVAQPRVPHAPPPTKAPRTPPRPPAPPPTPARGGTLQVSCSVRCEVRVDGAPSAAAAGAGVMVREGSHTVVVTNTATGAVRTLRVYVPTGVRVQRRVGF